MAQLQLQHLDKIYDNKVQAVYDFNLDVKDGELIVLVGPSGCGKSTTLRMVAGLEDISAGCLLLDGKDITQAPAKDRDMAMVFQNYALYGHMKTGAPRLNGRSLFPSARQRCPSTSYFQRTALSSYFIPSAACRCLTKGLHNGLSAF